MKLNKNDLKKIIQESVLKMMNEGYDTSQLDELYIDRLMDELTKDLVTKAKDFITNLNEVPEEIKPKMLDGIESAMIFAVMASYHD